MTSKKPKEYHMLKVMPLNVNISDGDLEEIFSQNEKGQMAGTSISD